MAALARKGCMRTGQRETCQRMVEFRSLPARRRVTNRAVCGKPGGGVVGIGGLLIIGQMAGSTISWRSRKPAIDVAQVARDREVRPCQWIGRETGVVKCC